ncbi:DNA gyrase/topoisomerase IV subunit A [Dyadobacter chenhuakuii]|uniref:DNA gyrase/topoisomerase IV subunit A n=1 Tax=Dyadobacter chenhuakuii TaxID=2909339 RepID=A0ABY4XL41_9BACT|nr:DNA gyrase/topoisomerase IV subunit A [Dyadobacter chenhuakuii]MCF2493821.1 DNA gyrase/topoisomerase IV subunit A [Dyadobacter chenhuakuii]USJ30953.1 DNA gyrase/topoisomerase IV subunit A [Dyadobacter chenhuakuii]
MDENGATPDVEDSGLHDKLPISGLYESWFLDYASYVILERAVPAVEDGLKPVQRRIMHALNEMDDGRFNKVANVVGSSMQYHPHGDASIYDAIVNIGQKELLFDTQGNWGDIRTGDGAAAARYIEVRLSRFAKEIVFNDDTTEWQLSYDGRKREPVTLPVKFPLLLSLGVEGIAVGLSTKILPHNFCELIEASISILQGKEATIYPDFLTGGQIDISNYNDGHRGGKVRVRARIEEEDKKMLVIRDIPFGTTTTSIIDSIIKANDTGKIKIRKVVDNTAAEVEIQVHLAPGVSPDITMDALYAFTECEVSISPNACIIIADKPHFVGVTEILKYNTGQTVHLLQRELEIKRLALLEKILYGSLEKIFIENRIYRDIEECETFEAVIRTIDKGLEPYKPQFYREITDEDIVELTEIKIKRISKYDGYKADELMKKWQEELAETEDNLVHITRFAIEYYKDLLKKYGKGRGRKTEIRAFNQISANIVAANNQKLYVNRAEGFIGYGLKKDEFVTDCSDIDDIIVFKSDGRCLVTKIQEKVFVGKDIIHCAVFVKNDERMVYNLVYLDGKTGVSYIKRCQITAVTRDREYDLTQGTPKSKITYFTANENGEAEIIAVSLSAQSKAKVKQFDFNFADLLIKNRSAMGNILTKYPVRKIILKQAGRSTLGGVDMWFDPIIGRLNRDERGEYLGNFGPSDSILVIYKEGSYELTNFDLTNHYVSNEVVLVKKFDPKMAITALYYDGGQKNHFIKRFNIETSTRDKKFLFISDAKNSKLLLASTDKRPRLEVILPKTATKEQSKEEYVIEEMVDVRGWRAMGNKLPNDKFKDVRWLEPLPEPEEEAVIAEVPNEEVSDEDSATEDVGGEEIATEEVADGDIKEAEAAEQEDNAGDIPPADDKAKPETDDSKSETGEDAKSDTKPKKEPKKRKDEKNQLGLF